MAEIFSGGIFFLIPFLALGNNLQSALFSVFLSGLAIVIIRLILNDIQEILC